MKSIRIKLVVLLLALALVPLLVSSWYNLSNNTAMLEKNISEHMLSIANVKQSSLDNHIKLVADNASALAGTDAVQEMLDSEASNAEFSQTPEYQAAYDLLLNYQESHWGVFHHVMIADPDGTVVLSPGHNNSSKAHLEQAFSEYKYFKPALTEPQVTDFFGFVEKDHFHQLYLQPIKNGAGEALGVLIFEIEIAHLKKLLSDSFELGESGRIFLTTLEGVEVVKSKEDLKPALNNDSMMAAIKEGYAIGKTLNRDGKEVFSIYLSQPEYPWVLTVEIDHDEVFQAVSKAKAAFFVTLVIVTTLILFVGILASRKIADPVIQMASVAERISAGDLEQQINYQSADEIGGLAHSFHKMVETLKEKAEVARKISKGIVDVEIEKSSEADVLGQAMIEMKDSLKAKVEAANQVAAGNLDTKVEVVSKDDVLGVAMVAMVNSLQASREEVDAAKAKVETNLEVAQSVVAEVNRVAGLLEEGHLKERAAVDDAEGAYRQLVDGFNQAIDNILKPVNDAVVCLAKMAKGDLRTSMNRDYKGDHAQMADTLTHTLDSFNEILGQVWVSVDEVAAGASQVSSASQALSGGATKQASSMQQTTATMQEISAQTKQNAENAEQANQLAAAARNEGEGGTEQMKKMLLAMKDINKSSDRISKIIKSIDEIAFQTNLLALNAAVEAARAGVHGKGFAVVAEEVRNLAKRSADAARQTTQLIEGSVKDVANGSKLADQTAKALGEIVNGVAKVTDLVAEIASASSEQALGIEQVSQGLSQIDSVTRANTANAEQSAAASEELSGQAAQVKRMLSRFQLRSGARAALSQRVLPVTVVDRPGSIADGDEGSWGATPAQPAGSDSPSADFIALDDDDFGEF